MNPGLPGHTLGRVLGRDYTGQVCSIARTLEVVGERWTLLIIRDALLGVTRFDRFAERLKLAPSTLTTRLNRLVEEGLMERRPYQERPVRHEYLLTERGRALLPVTLALMEWGDRYLAPDGAPAVARHGHCGGRVGVDTACAACGERVDAAGIEWHFGPGSQEGEGPMPIQPYPAGGVVTAR